MRVLVTGSAGFIGRHLCDALLKADHTVELLDVKYGHDIREPFVIEPCDWVFHLAGYAAVQPSLEAPAEWMRVNVQGTANVLEAARRAGVRRVVYAASGTYYGPIGAAMGPSMEHDWPQPITPYAESKYLGERLCAMYTRIYGLPTVSLRLFNPYGPGMSRANRMGEWLDMRRAGKVITVSGPPDQYRDYCYISDVVRAFILAAEADVTGPINIGSGTPVKIRDLVAMLGPYEFQDAGWQAPGTHADISRAKTLLGWEPTVSFEEGMRRVLEAEDRR